VMIRKCPQFKSLAICSHVVAAAGSYEDLEEFVKWYRTRSTLAPSWQNTIYLQVLVAKEVKYQERKSQGHGQRFLQMSSKFSQSLLTQIQYSINVD